MRKIGKPHYLTGELGSGNSVLWALVITASPMEMELFQPVYPSDGASSQSYTHKQLFQSFSCF